MPSTTRAFLYCQMSSITNSRPSVSHCVHHSSICHECPRSHWSGPRFLTMLCQNNHSETAAAVNVLSLRVPRIQEGPWSHRYPRVLKFSEILEAPHGKGPAYQNVSRVTDLGHAFTSCLAGSVFYEILLNSFLIEHLWMYASAKARKMQDFISNHRPWLKIQGSVFSS